MINVVCTQRIKPGMEAKAEALLREVEVETLAHNKGCLRYEWYRSEEPSTYILLERWVDMDAVQTHFKSPYLARLLPMLKECAVDKFAVMRLSRLE